MKKNNKKGFTLAELLIVVAIIAVLTAIAIPVFTTQLERSREATDLSNIRAAYAEAMTEFIADGTSNTSATVSKLQQQDATWHIDHSLTTRVDGSESTITLGNVTVGGGATVTVTIPASGTTKPGVTVSFGGAATSGATGS